MNTGNIFGLAESISSHTDQEGIHVNLNKDSSVLSHLPFTMLKSSKLSEVTRRRSRDSLNLIIRW